MLKRVNKVQCTIYGSNEELHDDFVNKKGSFKVVCENIVKLVANNINVTLCSMNNREENLEDTVQLAIKLGIKELQFGEIEPIGRAVQNRDKIVFYQISKAFIQRLQLKYRDKIKIRYEEGCGREKSERVLETIELSDIRKSRKNI